MMERAKEVKAVFSGLFAAATAVLGWFGWLVVIYAVSMGIDYITGSALAAKEGEWSSAKAREGLWHKAGSILAVIVAAIADLLIRVIIGHQRGGRRGQTDRRKKGVICTWQQQWGPGPGTLTRI